MGWAPLKDTSEAGDQQALAANRGQRLEERMLFQAVLCPVEAATIRMVAREAMKT